eukprot:555101-Pyramimonas_sp.AAC.1
MKYQKREGASRSIAAGGQVTDPWIGRTGRAYRKGSGTWAPCSVGKAPTPYLAHELGRKSTRARYAPNATMLSCKSRVTSRVRKRAMGPVLGGAPARVSTRVQPWRPEASRRPTGNLIPCHRPSLLPPDISCARAPFLLLHSPR